MSSVRLQLRSDRLSDGTVQSLANGLHVDLGRQRDLIANREVYVAPPGAKGDSVTLGVLLVTFMTSGAAVAAINVLKSYLERDRSLSVAVKRPDGSEVTLTAADAGSAEDLARRILGAEP